MIMNLRQWEIKIKPGIKSNHNIDTNKNLVLDQLVSSIHYLS